MVAHMGTVLHAARFFYDIADRKRTLMLQTFNAPVCLALLPLVIGFWGNILCTWKVVEELVSVEDALGGG